MERVGSGYFRVITRNALAGAGLIGMVMATALTVTAPQPVLAQGAASAAVSAAATQPQKVVGDFYRALETSMKNAQDLGFEGRYKVIGSAVGSAFDITTMARVATGSFWPKLSADDRTRVSDAFARLTAATYAANFKGYKGEKFQLLGEQAKGTGRVLVKSHLVKSDGEPVKFDYMMVQHGQDWKIVDIFLLGSISQLAVRKSEYASVLANDGVDGLIKAIDKQITILGDGSRKA